MRDQVKEQPPKATPQARRPDYGNNDMIKKFYFLRQFHLAENLPQATHTQNGVKLHKYGVKHALRILDGHFG